VSAPAWAEVVSEHAGSEKTAHRLVVALGELQQEALGFCRLLERWARGEADPSTAEARCATLRAAAERVERSLEKLERPLSRYLLELEPEPAEGQSWFGEPGAGELVDWEPVLVRAGVDAAPHLVAAVYLELAVLVRALEGLSSAVELEALPDRGSLWAGLFDLRENLVARARDELRAIAGSSGTWPSS
jgi:hypothetical protein